jgi:hypothetical protein
MISSPNRGANACSNSVSKVRRSMLSSNLAILKYFYTKANPQSRCLVCDAQIAKPKAKKSG